MADVSPIPYRIPVTDHSGLVTRNWQQFFQSLLDRTGGVGAAPSNTDLDVTTTVTDFVDMARASRLQRQLDRHEQLLAVSNGVPSPKPQIPTLGIFEGATTASVDTLREELRRTEILNIFSW